MKIAVIPLFALALPALLIAQPDWEDAVTILPTDYVTCATSDGYGQHIVIQNGATFKHLLLGNDGVKIASNSENVSPPRTNLDFGVSITNFGGVISIVARNSATQLYLYQSSDGGATWTNPIVYNPTAGSINQVDAFADVRGVHVVWDNTAGTKVYYVRYDPTVPGFVGFQEVTDLNGTTIEGYRPKVVTSANKVHVSYVRKDAGTFDVGASRDYDFTTSSWDNTDRLTAEVGSNIENQSMVLRGSTLHILMQRLGNARLYEARRNTDANWSTPITLISQGATSGPGNFPRTATVVGDTAYCAFTQGGIIEPGLKFLYYKPSESWPTPYFPVFSETYIHHTISSSKTGVYVFYRQTSVIGQMRRKVIALAGSITGNGFWTGKNWVSGDVNIESGRMVKAWPGSETTVLANKKIGVGSGATLIVEAGSQFTFESGASISTTGGTLRIENDATLTINNGAALLAEQNPGTIELGDNATVIIESDGNLVWNANTNWVFGLNARLEIHGTVKVGNLVVLTFPHNSNVYMYEGARFEMGAGASISTEGVFQALGTEQEPIEFVNHPWGVDGYWEGISVKSHQLINTGELQLEYATLSDGTKPVHIEPPAKATLNFVTISNPTIGIEIVWNPYGPPPTETTSIINTTIENAQLGISLVDCPSEILIQGCTITGNGLGGEAVSAGILLTNSSPRILSSTISGFDWGIAGTVGSSPILQQEDMHGGFNLITSNDVGAYFEGGSNAILGYYEGEGGQNSIFENFSYAVVLENESVVDA